MPSSAQVTGQRARLRLARLPLTTAGLAVMLLLAACGGVRRPPAVPPAAVPPGAIPVVVRAQLISRPRRAGFIGLSIEYPSSIGYLGRDPRRLDPVFLRLVRALNPGQSPSLRFGGDTTDWTWWPVPGMARPRGIRYTLTRRWLAVTAAAARALHARLILGVNLEAGRRRLAEAEARVLVRAIGPRYLAAFELGNEPEAYATLGWYYRHHTVAVPGRRPGYGLDAYLRDYAAFGSVLPRTVHLAGPASGDRAWLLGLGRTLGRLPRIALATFHRYPLHRCRTSRGSIDYPSIANLLRPVASSGPARSLAGAIAVAHAHGARFRADELNSVSCGGARGVSDTFAAALWALDTLFNMARVGADGVNLHTFQSALYAPFTFAHRRGHWTGHVRPLYYGLLMFARAAPAGSRLLRTDHAGGSALRVWSTRGIDGRVRVLLINDRRHRAAVTAIHLAPGLVRGGAPARLQRLEAPGLKAKQHVTLAGQSFGPTTTTGRLSGTEDTTTVRPVRGRFVVTVPPASAALLTTAGP